MSYPIWPIETRNGAHEPTPQTINHDSDAPHHQKNRGVDIRGVMHDYWIAIAHAGVPWVVVVGAWESLGFGSSAAGVSCEIQWEWQGQRYNLRYCHGHEPYASQWPDIRPGARVLPGEPIGEVGMTGNIFPPGPAGAHLHLAAAVGCSAGGHLESGQRIRADALLAEILTSYEPLEDDMTDYENQQLERAWQRAEALEITASDHEYQARRDRDAAKAIKNAVRMAKGEAVEQ